MSTHCRNCGKPTDADFCRCGAPALGGRKFCHSCGNPTYMDETECQTCNSTLESGPPNFKNTIVASDPPKSPGMIAALSIIPFPWLGQIFLGQTAKGVTMLIATYVLSTACVGFVLVPIAAFDAYKMAKILEDGGSNEPWEFFWSRNKSAA